MQNFAHLCFITSKIHSQSKKVKFNSWNFHMIMHNCLCSWYSNLTNCIHKLCETIAKIFCKIILFEEIITGEWGDIRKFTVPSPPLIEDILYNIRYNYPNIELFGCNLAFFINNISLLQWILFWFDRDAQLQWFLKNYSTTPSLGISGV